MNRIILIFLLLTFALCLIQPIQAQQSDEQRAMLLKELEAESKYNQELLQQAEEVRQKIMSLRLLQNAEMDKKIKQAIADNDIPKATEYFDSYCRTLDSLVVHNPTYAQKTIIKLKTMYQNVPSVWDRIYYYSGATDYFLLSYAQAEKNLRSMLELYPDSSKRTEAISLLLKTYIISGNEAKSIAFIEANKSSFDDESNYLTGHIYFVLERDSVSATFLRKVKNPKFINEAQKMLSLISSFQDDKQIAYDNFKLMLESEPQNPFILLSLARLSVMTGQWAEAEKYYYLYNQAAKQRNEIASQYELAMAYLNLGDNDKTLEILNGLLANKDLGEFYSPTLYLWSEITTNKSNASISNQRVDQLVSSINSNVSSLPLKADLMDRIVSLKNQLKDNSSIEEANIIVADLSVISTQLDSINSVITSNPTSIPSVQLKKWELYEKQMTVSFLEMLRQYISAHNLRNYPDSTHIKQFDLLERNFTDQIARIERIKANLQKQAEANVALALRNEAEQNILVYESILSSLKLLQSTGTQSYTPAELDSLISNYERQKTETTLLLDYYDYDNSLYTQVIAECDAAAEDAKRLLAQIPSLKEQYRANYSLYVSKIEKKAINKDIDNLIVLVPEYRNSIEKQQVYLTKLLTDMEFISLHVAFTETVYFEKQKVSQGQNLTFEENQKLFSENQSRKQAVYDRIIAFMNKYPNFISMNVPKDYPTFISSATLNYELAELSYSLWQDRPELALSYFRKVNELDPKFYNRAAVLYNVGYISSMLEKKRIENGIEMFSNTNAVTTNKPANLLYSEENYNESISAYGQLINEFQDSPFYSEALLRLGFIYFEIGTDAERPVEYYQLARSYYDKLADKKDDPNRFQALYQRGWTWLNSSSEEAYVNGMNDFVAILNAIDQGVIADSTESIDYTLAAIKNIGYCLIGLDGSNNTQESKGAKYAQITLSPLVNTKNRNQIIDEAITQKLRLYLPMQAVDFMNVKITLDPMALVNPIIADSICALYAAYPSQIRGNSPTDSVYMSEKIKIINSYGFYSDWYKANKDLISSKQITVLNKAFADVEKRYNNQFIDFPTQENFNQYTGLIDHYTSYTVLHDDQFKVWAQNKQFNIIGLSNRLAVNTQSPVAYLQTANRIYSYNDAFPDNENYFNLEGVAFDCVRVVFDSLSTELIAVQGQNPVSGLPSTLENLVTVYNTASDRFKGVLLSDRFKSPQNDYMYITIVLKQAELARDKQQLDTAVAHYQTIVNFKGDISRDILRSSYINMAEIADSTKNYTNAEKWYLAAETYSSDANDKNMIHQYALLQIQNSIDDAKMKGDNVTVAKENLRLSDEYANSDPTKKLQYIGKAQMAYLDAKDYQKSIDLLIQISTSTNKPEEVLNFYRLAWTIADSVGYKQQADSLKQAFINLHPSSNEAYQLRLAMIDKVASNSQTVSVAGDMYIALYQDAISKKIDIGTEKPEDLYLAAIGMFAQSGDESKKQELADQFINTYPSHPETINLMEYIADRYLAKGDTLMYEQLAKNIYKKDSNRSSRYENLVKNRLRIVAVEFEKAYQEQDWKIAFSKRDDFTKLQTSYEKEGLKFDFGTIHERFKLAEEDYNIIQERLAFLKKFDSQLATIESGFLRKNPGELIRININTNWKNNLIGGKENRIQNLKNLTAAEANKVKKVLESSTQYELDVDRRLRAFNLICRINEFGADVIKTQVNQWMNTSVEFSKYKKQFEGNEDELYTAFNTQRDGHAMSLLQQAYPYYLAMYKYFYIPGYVNKYTQNAYNRLVELGGLPKYRFDEVNMNSDWSIALVDIADSSNITSININSGTTTSPRGSKLYTFNIPANRGLIMKKTVNSKVAPEYIIANLVSPFYQDSVIKLNGETSDYAFNAIDTLEVNKPNKTRYALTFGDNKLTMKDNEIEFRFFNYGSELLQIGLNVIVITDSVKIEAAVPQETVKIPTDEYWQYSVLTNGEQTGSWKFSSDATAFGFDKQQWYEMESTNAKAIWVGTEDVKDTLAVVFKKDFKFDGVLKDGYIQFIAPDVATVKINGKEVSTEVMLNYDPEANLVFAGKAYLTADIMKQGTNTMEIIVTNNSQWKGMVAELIMTVSHPE